MVPGIDARVDYAFKRLFGVEQNRHLLLDLLNAVLNETGQRRIADVEILNTFHPKEFHEDKLSIVDVRARDQAGRVLIVEMQMVPFSDLPKRYLHYWASSYRKQISEGEGYSNLCPVIVIAFIGGTLFRRSETLPLPYHLQFRLQDARHSVIFSDDIELHTIELPRLPATPDQLQSPLDVWGWFLEHSKELDTEAIPTPLSNDSIRHALREMAMISQTTEERELYEARLMRQRDDQARMEDALRSGFQQGMQEGMQQGLESGKTAGQEIGRSSQLRRTIPLLERVLRLSVTPAGTLAAMSLPELEARMNELEQLCPSDDGQ